MANEFANAVFDAALDEIGACTELEVRTAASSVLIDAQVLNSANFGANGDYASGGRERTCLVSSTNDMSSIAVGTGGLAKRIVLIDASAADVAITELTSAVSLGSSDLVNIGTFVSRFTDPPGP